MWNVEFWEDKRGKRPGEEWFKDLPKIDKKEVAKLFGLLETFGYQNSIKGCWFSGLLHLPR